MTVDGIQKGDFVAGGADGTVTGSPSDRSRSTNVSFMAHLSDGVSCANTPRNPVIKGVNMAMISAMTLSIGCLLVDQDRDSGNLKNAANHIT